jgi:uncharacterized protein (TIGR03437 family)
MKQIRKDRYIFRATWKARAGRLTRAFVLIPFLSVAFGQTGTPDIPPFDQFMSDLMNKYSIPGAALTITRNGHIIMARGYGLKDRENNVPMQPDTLLRMASLSKTITAVTIMHLVETGQLTLDQPAFALLPDLQPLGGKDKDPRLAAITIRQLLTHSGGWDSEKSGFDPTGSQGYIASFMGVPSPVSSDDMVRYMRGEVLLDCNPGDCYAYSNFGYDVLARIIDRVTGMSYEQYVRTNVFAPVGITTARIGQTLPQGQLPGEAKYYANQKTQTIFPDETPKVAPVAYGAWYMEGFDGDGGWVVSPVDFAKFINAIDGQKGTAFLKPSSVAEMTARPNIPYWNGQTSWYGFGMAVQPTAKGQIWWNDGAIDGTFTRFTRTDDGLVMVAFLNSRSNPAGREGALQNDTDAGLSNTAAQVTNWPNVDYIELFPDADPAQAALKPALTTSEGARNGATFARGLVPGSWSSLFGVNLSKTTRGWSDSDFIGDTLPTSLDGVSVKIAGKPAPVSYISPTQINAQVPSDIEPGWVAVEVTNNGVSTTDILTWITKYAPGVFTYTQDGITFAAAMDANGSPVLPESPAKPGEVVVMYATGLQLSNAGVLLSANHPIDNILVQIRGQAATVQYAGLVGPGLFQINFFVPEVAAGNQPIYITSHSTASPTGVMIPIGSK